MNKQCKYCKFMSITLLPPSNEQYCTKKHEYIKLDDICVDFIYDEHLLENYVKYGDIEMENVKIDRFKIEANGQYITESHVIIVDYLECKEIASFTTKDKELNMRLAEHCFKKLNEEYKNSDDEGYHFKPINRDLSI